MAKAKISAVKLFKAKPKRKRPGVHAKTKASKLKGSKNAVVKNITAAKIFPFLLPSARAATYICNVQTNKARLSQ